jgi:hypothetical protein
MPTSRRARWPVLPVSSAPVPAALCGGPHARDYLLSHRGVGPSLPGRRRFFLTRNWIGVRRPDPGDQPFARRRVSPPSLHGFTYFGSTGRAIERGSHFRPHNGIGPSRFRCSPISLAHFRSDDPRSRVSGGLSHFLRPSRGDWLRNSTNPITLAHIRSIDQAPYPLDSDRLGGSRGRGRVPDSHWPRPF